MLVRICRIVSSRSSTVARIRSAGVPGPSAAGSALQGQPGGEEPLDDVVVQVGGDPLALVEHGDPLLLGPRLGQLDREGGLVGEAGGHVELLGLRTPAPPAPAGPEDPVDLCRAEQWHGEHRAELERRCRRETAASPSGIDSRSGIPVLKTCPDNEPVIGRIVPISCSAPVPTATSMRRSSVAGRAGRP